jgi:DNA replication protein DnaC
MTDSKSTPARPWNRTLADYKTGHPEQARARAVAGEFAKRIMAKPYDDGGMVSFLGPCGTGKTFLAKCVMSELGWDTWGTASKLPEVVRAGQLLDRSCGFRDCRKISDVMKSGVWSYADSLIHDFRILCLDDFGADYDKSGAVASSFDRILRGRARKWTILTSNLCLKDISALVDDRVASWLIRDGNAVMTFKDCPDWSTGNK